MGEIKLKAFQELAPSAAYSNANVKKPDYGRFLDDYVEGDVYVHPRALTVDRAFALEYATTFHDACPLFLSAPYAQAHGFRDLVVSPLQVFNFVLSLGVQNDSEKAIANLGYYNVTFVRPVYPGDTITAKTKVVGKKDIGGGRGIGSVQTMGFNQNGEVVLQYERKIMLSPKKEAGEPKRGNPAAAFTWTENPPLVLPDFKKPSADFAAMTASNTYFEDFEPGQIIVHRNMRTITDEHVPWTYRVGNTHPLHYDRLYSTGQSGPMSGEPIVYGGLVFGWLAGMASRDTTENMLWDFGYTEGYHTQPAISGDTVGAISRILSKEDGPVPGTGVIQTQLIGVKNIKTPEVFDKYGEDLFIKENNKKALNKEKIPEKIFEIERRILIKKR
ncbi:MAG: MaoC family dehydratase N-terminal domain-containing protein [Spirochaetia bacterium]|nr:MaoC family dehydratase N-terminal domain-containing protein [Spirochaetia bacterium]